MTTTKDDVSNSDQRKQLKETLQPRVESLVKFSKAYFHASFAPSDSKAELVLPSLDKKQEKILKELAQEFRCFFKRRAFAYGSLDIFEEIQSDLYYAEVKAQRKKAKRAITTNNLSSSQKKAPSEAQGGLSNLEKSENSYYIADIYGYVYSIYWMQFFIECSDASQELRIFLRSFKLLYPVAAFGEKNFPVNYCRELYENGLKKAGYIECANKIATDCVNDFFTNGVPSYFSTNEASPCNQESDEQDHVDDNPLALTKA